MIGKFLKAKHWQLFTLMVGIPIVFQIMMMISMFSEFGTESNSNPEKMFDYMKYFPLIMTLYMGIFFGWFWSIAIGLQSKVPRNVKMKIKKFKIFFFIPLTYMTILLVYMANVFHGILSISGEPSGAFIGGIFAIILPLHLFSMFCMFYLLYFVSKTIKTVELQKEVSFGDFAGEFFLLWFYFIGIWIIQPKINKMVEE